MSDDKDKLSAKAFLQLQKDARLGRRFRELWHDGAPWPISNHVSTADAAREAANLAADEYELWFELGGKS